VYYRDDKYLKRFGANLRKVRKARGISQEELGNDLDFSQAHIARIEAGSINTSISHIVAIAKILKVHPSELFIF